MKQIKLGFTDYTALVYIPDPASTDGSGKTGLVAANLTVSYTRVETDNDVVVTDVTSSLNNLAALTTAHTDWGLLEVSNTLAPGLYRLDIADAVFASGAWSAVVYVMITTSAAAASPMEFILVAFDPLDTVRLGLTALPNAAAEAAGGLYTRGTGAGQINQAANGQVDSNVTHAAGTAWGSGAITAASIATGAIDADAIADNAIDAGAIATGAITAAKFAAGAIDAAAIATGAIDADALAADAGTEIGTAVWATATRSLTVLDEDSTTLDLDATIRAAVGLAAADLDTQLAALPTAAENADAVWDEDATGHQSAGTFGLAIGDPGASTETLYKAIVTDPAGTNIAADIIAIKAETASILTDTAEIGAAGAGLSAVPWNASWDAEVQSEATDALNAYAAATLEGTLTRDGAQKIILAASAGKVSGAATTEVTIRDTADAVDRIVATVDADGNRSAVTLDAT